MTERSFNGQSTTDDVLKGLALEGKQFVVTGGGSGIGQEAARALCSKGANVLITARSADKAEAAIAAIRESEPDARLDWVMLELANLDSVRTAAAQILQRCPVIDVLINNAGVMACPLMRTDQGFEMQFGSNHIGHFLLSCLLAPALQAAKSARVVSLSSGGHKYAPVDFDDPNYQQRDYDKWQSYGQSKTANALFAVGINKRLAGVTANAVHPGVIATNLGRHMTEDDYKTLGAAFVESGIQYKTVEQGAATTVWAATAPELEGQGGLYLEDCHIGQPAGEDDANSGYLPYALDAEQADRLWALSEELVGQKFSF